MYDLVERLKSKQHWKWYIFALERTHGANRMLQRNVTFRNLKDNLKVGELLPNQNPDVIRCVGNSTGRFMTAILRPLLESRCWELWDVRPSYEPEIEEYKKLKRLKKNRK